MAPQRRPSSRALEDCPDCSPPSISNCTSATLRASIPLLRTLFMHRQLDQKPNSTPRSDRLRSPACIGLHSLQPLNIFWKLITFVQPFFSLVKFIKFPSSVRQLFHFARIKCLLPYHIKLCMCASSFSQDQMPNTVRQLFDQMPYTFRTACHFFDSNIVSSSICWYNQHVYLPFLTSSNVKKRSLLPQYINYNILTNSYNSLPASHLS